MNPHSRRAAFTLIELLVVISIIALLISILLPALGAAREAGRGAACLSNQRQLAIALNTYANDNSKGFFPALNNTAPNYASTGGYFWWTRMIREGYFAGGDGTGGVLMCPTGLPQLAPSNMWSNPVSSDPEVDPLGMMYVRADNGAPEWRNISTNYAINVYPWMDTNSADILSKWANRCFPFGVDHFKGATGMRLDQIIHTSQLMLTFDGLAMNSINATRYSLRHASKSANVSFIDGHVSSIPTARMPQWGPGDQWGNKDLLTNKAGTLGFMVNDVPHVMW